MTSVLLFGCVEGTALTSLLDTADSESTTSTGVDTATATKSETGSMELTVAGVPFDSGHPLVVTHTGGIDLLDNLGELVITASWDGLVPSGVCSLGCQASSITEDSDGILVAWARDGQKGNGVDGGILRLKVTRTDIQTDWSIEGYSFPHGAVWSEEGWVVVADTFQHRVVWMDPEQAGLEQFVFDQSNEQWGEIYGISGMQLISTGGRSYLLLSNIHKNNEDGLVEEGGLGLWDVSDPADITVLWRYPESGYLRNPHGARLVKSSEGWLLTYAHSNALNDSGTVAFATSGEIETQPMYSGEFSADPGVGTLIFPKSVEMTSDGELIILDSAFYFGVGSMANLGWVYRVPMPVLPVSGKKTGAYTQSGSQMQVESFEGGSIIKAGYNSPFEANIISMPME